MQDIGFLLQDIEAGRQVVIHTDMEPDDVIAFGIIAGALRKLRKLRERMCPLAVTVGERDADKVAMVVGLCASLDLPLGSVTQVERTEQEFPRALLGVYAGAARPVASLAHPADALGEPCSIVCIAPPRWLLRAFEGGANLAPHRFYMYGSFNCRTLLQEKFVDVATLTAFLGAFERTLVFETRDAIGSDNSATPGKDPEFYDAIGAEAALCTHIWTKALVDKQLAKIARLGPDPASASDKAALRRAQKLVDSAGSPPQQVVLADVGLMVALLVPGDWLRRGTLTFAPDTFYSTFAECADGGIYFVKDMGRARLIREAIALLQ